MRLHVLACCLVLSVLASSPAGAQRLVHGKSVAWVGLNGNKAQIVHPTTANGADEESEVGLHLAYSYFLSDAWTIVFSGGFDIGRQTFEPKTGTDIKLSMNSYNARLGFDRYAFINDNVAFYAGPGLLYWSGSAELDGTGVTALDIEGPQVSQIAFNGRAGMYARFAAHYGLFGHIGQVIGRNSADDDQGKLTWWSNHHEGSVGIAVDF